MKTLTDYAAGLPQDCEKFWFWVDAAIIMSVAAAMVFVVGVCALSVGHTV